MPLDSSRPLDLICMGRVAADLYSEQIGSPLEASRSFRLYLGGCAGNIAVGCSRLGLRVALLSKVGTDDLGTFLRQRLESEGVDTSLLLDSPGHLTGLVVLGIAPPDRFPLIFFRENCADMQLEAHEVDVRAIQGSRAILITGTGLSQGGIRRTTHRAIEVARESGTAIVLDIDYRPVLWGLTDKGDGESRFVDSGGVTEKLQEILPDVDLVVGTEEEFAIAAGVTEPGDAARSLRHLTDATLVLKRGAEGCEVHPKDEDVTRGAPFQVPILNVLGAGDAFMAGFLRGWLRGEGWSTCADWANANGALVVSRHGCSPAMAGIEELRYVVEQRDRRIAPNDPVLESLHRLVSDTRPVALCLLAFDHRQQFEASCDEHARDRACIATFKDLVYRGFERAVAAGRVTAPAILVDSQYGSAVQSRALAADFMVGIPIETAGSLPVQWVEPGSLYGQILKRDGRSFVKVLVRHSRDLATDVRRDQIEQLRRLMRVCDELERRLMIEVVPPEGATLGPALADLLEAGLRPTWWKVPGASSAAEWEEVVSILDHHQPSGRIVILGQAASLSRLEQWFRLARSTHHGVGFAIGRTVMWEAWERWVTGDWSDDRVVDVIAERYERVAELWHAAGLQQREEEAS